MTKSTGKRQQRHREHAALWSAGLKRCGRCGETKSLDDYHTMNSTRDHLCPRCRTCELARLHEQGVRHSEKRAADSRARRECKGDVLRARDRAVYAAHRDDIAATRKARYWDNPAKYRDRANSWRARNLESARAADRENAHLRYRLDRARVLGWQHARRARKVSAPGACTPDQFRARWDYYGGRCWMCWGIATTMDHVVPLAHGGSNWPANLRPACRSCNSRKSARDWRDYSPGAMSCMRAQPGSYSWVSVSWERAFGAEETWLRYVETQLAVLHPNTRSATISAQPKERDGATLSRDAAPCSQPEAPGGKHD